jgi:flagellar hook-length control protein FliK
MRNSAVFELSAISRPDAQAVSRPRSVQSPSVPNKSRPVFSLPRPEIQDFKARDVKMRDRSPPPKPSASASQPERVRIERPGPLKRLDRAEPGTAESRDVPSVKARAEKGEAHRETISSSENQPAATEASQNASENPDSLKQSEGEKKDIEKNQDTAAPGITQEPGTLLSLLPQPDQMPNAMDAQKWANDALRASQIIMDEAAFKKMTSEAASAGQGTKAQDALPPDALVLSVEGNQARDAELKTVARSQILDQKTSELSFKELLGQNGQSPDPSLQSSPAAQQSSAKAAHMAFEKSEGMKGSEAAKPGEMTASSSLSQIQHNPSSSASPSSQSFSSQLMSSQTANSSATPPPGAWPAASSLAPVPLYAVPIEIGMRALEGNRNFQIRLNPEDLGRVDVQLDISKDGDVKAILTVDRVETLHLLQRDAKTLERAFEQAGLKTSDNALNLTLRDDGASRQRQDQQQRSPQFPTWTGKIESSDLLRPEPVIRRMTWRGDSGIDVRI